MIDDLLDSTQLERKDKNKSLSLTSANSINASWINDISEKLQSLITEYNAKTANLDENGYISNKYVTAYTAATATLTTSVSTIEFAVATNVKFAYVVSANSDTIETVTLGDISEVDLESGSEIYTISSTTTKTLVVTIADADTLEVSATVTAISPQWCGVTSETLSYTYANSNSNLTKTITEDDLSVTVSSSDVADDAYLYFLSNTSGLSIYTSSGFALSDDSFTETTITQTLSNGSTATMYQYVTTEAAVEGTFTLK